MEFFAICHVPTGRLLPAPRGRGGRGGSHVEFGDEGLPRLFGSAASAKTALTYWLRGAINVTYRQSGEFGEDVTEDRTVTPKSHRVAAECRVVRVVMEVADHG